MEDSYPRSNEQKLTVATMARNNKRTEEKLMLKDCKAHTGLKIRHESL